MSPTRRIQKVLWASLAGTIPMYLLSESASLEQRHLRILAVCCLFYQAILLLLSSREHKQEVSDHKGDQALTLNTNQPGCPLLPFACRKLFVLLPSIFTVGWIVSLGFNAALIPEMESPIEAGLRDITIILMVFSAANVILFGVLAYLCARERRRLMGEHDDGEGEGHRL